MEIVYHVGVHGSDQDRLIRTLLRNRDQLWRQGIEIPAPNRYRGVLGEAIAALKGGIAAPDIQEMLLDAVMDSDQANRVVLSQSAFLSMPNRAVSPAGFYPNSHNRIRGLSNLFPDSTVEFFIGLVHPAKQISELIKMTRGKYDTIMADVDPHVLSWTPLIMRLLDAAPDRRIVVWAQEDLPFTWPEVLRRIAGVSASTPMLGEDAILSELLSTEAMATLQERINTQPDLDIGTRRELVELALTSADTDSMEIDIDLPGWSQDLIDELSETYADDLAKIAALPNLEFISA